MSDSDGRFPTLFMVGAQRCATSTLYHYFKLHPELFVSTPKEPRFFSHRGEQPIFKGPGDADRINNSAIWNEAEYLSLFANAKAGQTCCEATTTYLHDTTALKAIKQSVSEARVVALIRNPIERALSCWQYKTNQGLETESFEVAIQQEPKRIASGWAPIWHYTQSGLYANAIRTCHEIFGSDSVRVYRYDSFSQRPSSVLADIASFLGLNQPFPVESGVHDNAASHLTRKVQTSPIQRMRMSILRRLGFSNPIHHRTSSVRRLKRETFQQLAEVFETDIRAVEQLVNDDLSDWLKFQVV